MRSSKRIYLHKEDVWSNGDHWMSSASRDIFEHFYKSIKSTFLNQFKDQKIREISEKINNVRQWESQLFNVYHDAAMRKTTEVSIKEYHEICFPLPEENEYNEGIVVPKHKMIYDPIIYPNFETFFKQANHGFDASLSGKQTCYGLYRLFIKKNSYENLQQQLTEELLEARNWQQQLHSIYISYLNQNSDLSWHKFLSNNLDND